MEKDTPPGAVTKERLKLEAQADVEGASLTTGHHCQLKEDERKFKPVVHR